MRGKERFHGGTGTKIENDLACRDETGESKELRAVRREENNQ